MLLWWLFRADAPWKVGIPLKRIRQRATALSPSVWCSVCRGGRETYGALLLWWWRKRRTGGELSKLIVNAADHRNNWANDSTQKLPPNIQTPPPSSISYPVSERPVIVRPDPLLCLSTAAAAAALWAVALLDLTPVKIKFWYFNINTCLNPSMKFYKLLPYMAIVYKWLFLHTWYDFAFKVISKQYFLFAHLIFAPCIILWHSLK